MAVGSSESLAADEVRLRYRDEGQGPAVLLIHGWTLELEMWEPQVASLRDRFRLIRFDRRGFGLSEGTPSLRGDVEDALELCRSLGLKQFACVGMSQGARVALQLALEVPEWLSCLVLDGPPDFLATSAESDFPTLGEDQNISPRETMRLFRERWRRHPLMKLWRADPPNRALLDRMLDRYPGLDLDAGTTQNNLPVDARELRSIRIPTLIIGGEHDLQNRRKAADELARALPVAERITVPGCGHLPNLDDPQAYNRILSDFLEGSCCFRQRW
jgi:pimeloyl-ACP methyl ester carboxylesterase